MGNSNKKCKDHFGRTFDNIDSMCSYWGISRSTFNNRRQAGYSIKASLTGAGINTNHSKKCKDHLGQEFDSIADMCRHWGITASTLTSRKRYGYGLKTCLTGEGMITHNNLFIDHLGNKFLTLDEMCRHWCVDKNLFLERKHKGCDVKTCLLGDRKENIVEDHLGNEFASEQEMCEYWKVDYRLYKDRLRSGCDIKTSLIGRSTYRFGSGNRKECVDHLGNKFKSIHDMCEYWKVDYMRFCWRRNNGYSLEHALTGKQMTARSTVVEDHLGNKFENLQEMCDYYHVSYGAYISRIHNGYTVEESLTGNGVNIRCTGIKCTDHEGNKFNSVVDMCKYWGVHRPTYIARQKAGYSLKACLTGEGVAIAHRKRKEKSETSETLVKMPKQKTLSAGIRMAMYVEDRAKQDRLTSADVQNIINSIGNSGESGSHMVIDHLGNMFKTEEEMCKHYKIDVKTYRYRIAAGLTLQEALTL